MKYYTGLDVSMKTTSICIVNQEKKVVLQDTVPTNPDLINALIVETGLEIEKIALESGSLSHWLVKELKARGLPVICIESRRMAKILSININKTDKNDAQMIAEAVRSQFYVEVHHKSQENVEAQILINARRNLKETENSLRNAVRGHLKAFGILLGNCGKGKFCRTVQKHLEDKSEHVKCALEGLLNTLSEVTKQLEAMEKQIKKMAHEDEDIKLLKTVPGVGLLIAYSFKVMLGDPKRFTKSRSVGAYFGMTPRQYSSGETHHMGRISKCGSKEMRFLLNEAATVMMYRTKSWSRPKAWGLKLVKKKGHKKASMAVGRKLCTIMHKMLITGKPFEYGEPQEEKLLKRKLGK